MYFLYALHSNEDDDVPWDKQHWWHLRFKHSNKEEVLQWYNKYKRENTRYKLVCTDKTLKDTFYPRKEMKTKTTTSKFLRRHYEDYD